MKTIDPIYTGGDAVGAFIQYISQHHLSQFVLVSDENTYHALGKRVESALQRNGNPLTTIILKGEEVIADEACITEVFTRAPVGDYTYIAVGSGTITDITRFVSHRSKNPFISLPTAPSVDGFTSIGAPLVLRGVKTTIICQPPLAFFADLPALQAAPQRLIASGFGDMIGKVTSLADWKLGRLLWNEPFDRTIADRSQKGVDTCISYADAIGSGDEEGIRHLMDALVESGLCMLEFGDSRPASGAEHHYSHYWEMMLLQQHRPAILHGAKVGFATTLVVQMYERIRQMSQSDIDEVLEAAVLPSREQDIATIRTAYGHLADDIIAAHEPFLNMTAADYEQFKRRVRECWGDIQKIAQEVPSSAEIAAVLEKVHAPVTGEAIGLTQDEVNQGLQYGHYLRNRLTSRKLFHMLGLPVVAESRS